MLRSGFEYACATANSFDVLSSHDDDDDDDDCDNKDTPSDAADFKENASVKDFTSQELANKYDA
eukprot:2035034-Karenia_brevis.AAC.1